MPGLRIRRSWGFWSASAAEFALVEGADVTMRQTEVRLRSAQLTVSRPVRQPGDIVLAHDVLDHQLVDLSGVQVVRAADVYLVNGPRGWELADVDVGLRSLARRLLPKARVCPPPARAIDWADLQAFVPRFTETALTGEPGPAAAGDTGGGVQFARPTAELTKLRGRRRGRHPGRAGPRPAGSGGRAGGAIAGCRGASPTRSRTSGRPACRVERNRPGPAKSPAERRRHPVTKPRTAATAPCGGGRWTTRVLAVLAILGPGLIAANAGNDAGGILTYASADSQFAYRTLFLMLLVIVALVIVQEMCSSLGVYTGEGLGRTH